MEGSALPSKTREAKKFHGLCRFLETVLKDEELKAILAETPLVKNLDNQEYLKIILNGCETLEERFARIESKLAQRALQKSLHNTERISPEMRKLVRRPDFPKKLVGYSQL